MAREASPAVRSTDTVTATPTDVTHVSKVFGGGVVHRCAPFDLLGAVSRFLRRVDPRIAIVMGTEIRPNLPVRCRLRAVPVILANVRLSERSAAGYRRFRRLFEPALRGVVAIAVQSEEDARRIAAVGAPRKIADVTGNTKLDVAILASVREEAAALRRTWGSSRGIWMAASTHAGEEQQVFERLPGRLLVLVPRRPERFREVAALARRRGYDPATRSHRTADCTTAQVFIGDTIGELIVFYAAADVSFVGGTLVERGGHIMLEPAALGLPVLYGPHVFNFADIGPD